MGRYEIGTVPFYDFRFHVWDFALTYEEHLARLDGDLKRWRAVAASVRQSAALRPALLLRAFLVSVRFLFGS